MAELPSTYSTGTVSVGAGSTTVTGVGTNWVTAGVEAGDIFWAAGLSVRIATVNSATSITLAYVWPGSALSGSNYEVRFTPDATRVLSSARAVLSSLTNGNISSLGSLTTAANKLAYYTGAGVAALTDLTSEARTLLGSTALSRSGTVYTLNGSLAGTAVTQSANDSTAGRLMKVFDFGIGNPANTTAISSSGPLSTFPSGLSRISGGSSEQPAGVGSGTVFTACNQIGRMAQQVHSTQNNKLYIRSSHDSVWTAWAEIMSSNNVTQTDLDTTAGRLMKVGDYGLGRAAGVYPPEYNFNTWGASPSGMYWYNNTGDAGPSGYGTVIALNYAAAKQHRIALNSDDSRMYIGSISASGIQSTWSEIFGQKNILGTVSQSGGVPTGALIERGNNANGEYVRFADGTQICNTEVLTSTSAETARTWPAAFSATPRVLCGCSGGTVGFARSNVVTATAVEVSAYNTSGARITGYVTIAAFGRWF